MEIKPLHITKRNEAFTIVELLAVVVSVAVLGTLLVTGLTKSEPHAIGAICTSNLKQIGAAIVMHSTDNNDYLPGPCAAVASPAYYYLPLPDGRSNSEFSYYLSAYLGGKDPSHMTASETNFIQTLFCPSFGSFSKTTPTVAMTRPTYGLSFPHTNSEVRLSVRPFGATTTSDGPASIPIKRTEISRYGQPSDIFAVSDLSSVENKPLNTSKAHGNSQNALYFDGQVKSHQGTNSLLP